MRAIVIILLFIIFPSIFHCCNSPQPEQDTRNIILDVDVSVDDMMTILYFLTCSDINIKAITIAEGVSDVETGTEIVLRLLNLTGHEDIPVAKGVRKPLEGKNAFPLEWKPSVDQPFGLQLPPQNLKPYELPADSLIARLISEHRNNISVFALGPMTNVATCFLKNPELAGEVSNVVVSDGAINITGAIYLEYPEISNTVSGWNQWVDPKAADIVFNCGAPISLIPLDITALHSEDAIVLSEYLIEKFNKIACNPEGKALKTLMNQWIGWYHSGIETEGKDRAVPIWDVVAALIYHHPEIATEWMDCKVQVERGNPEIDGQIVVTEDKNSPVRIYLKGKQALFDSLFLESAACLSVESDII